MPQSHGCSQLGQKETNELLLQCLHTLERRFLLVSGVSVSESYMKYLRSVPNSAQKQKMAGRVLDVLDVCPQLVPQDRTKRFYDGYITVCVSYYCVNK